MKPMRSSRYGSTMAALVASALVTTLACSDPPPVLEEAPPGAGAPLAQAAPHDDDAAAAPAFPAAPASPAVDAALDCSASDTRPTIVLRGCDTGVANGALGECTLADHLRVCENGPVEDFPRCVAKTTERWIETGVIQGRDKGLIQACAADDRESPRERTDDV